MKESFYDILLRLRNDRGESQGEIADRIGITRSAYSRYETGIRVPETDIAIRLARYFGVSVEYLFGFSESQNELDSRILVTDTEREHLNIFRRLNENNQTIINKYTGFLLSEQVENEKKKKSE